METSQNWTLKQIADWTTEPFKIKIPALQRGLVWKPRQVELLWDSILRRFPIGSFLLSKNNDNSYDLMDGQQRFNAIATAFAELNSGTQSELWIDIAPPQVNTTRLFWIKATTIAHPWGYKNDDDCKILTASERRNALVKFKRDAQFNVYQKHNGNDLTLFETFPFAATAPVPLKFLIDAAEHASNESEFTKNIVERIKSSNRNFAKDFNYDEGAQKLAALYHTFDALKYYTVHSNIIDTQNINIEGNNTEDASNLEILFNRLNTQGTPITAAELKYSAIKAYWPEIRDINNALAQGYMPPEKLVLTLFRLVLTDESRSPKGEPTIKQIRDYASKDSIKADIKDEYNHCHRYLETINDWLDINSAIDSTPQILRSRIINRSPDLFFLLLFIAKHKSDVNKHTIKAFAFYTHFFIPTAFHKNIVNHFVQRYYMESSNISIESFFYEEIADIVHSGSPLLTYQNGIKFDQNEVKSYSNNWINETIPFPEAQRAYNLICGNRDILLYAQRKFLNTFFDKYLSETGNTWDEHNVPWDYDHIIPQEWITSQRKNAIPFCKLWLNTIGNLAAIPFEVNRSKSNNGEWDYYQKYADLLLFDEKLISDNLTKGNIKYNEGALKFANYTLQRLQKIYNELDTVLQPINFNNVLNLPSENYIMQRYRLIQELKSLSCGEIQTYYFNNGTDVEITHPLNWCSLWIIAGYRIDNKYFVAITSRGKAEEIEIGIRKINHTDSENISIEGYETTNNQSWFVYKTIPGNTPANEIFKELNLLKGQISKL